MELVKSLDLNCYLCFLGRIYWMFFEVIGDFWIMFLYDEDSGEDIWCR